MSASAANGTSDSRSVLAEAHLSFIVQSPWEFGMSAEYIKKPPVKT
jgi:hypothetical protein